MSKLFLLTIAVAGLIVAGAGVFAFILFRRETKRAQFGRPPSQLSDVPPPRRHLAM